VSNQDVLIRGGLSGISRAAAIAFAKQGATVVVAGRRDEAGNALVLSAAHVRGHVLNVDGGHSAN
jgi:NAD(P)-dependent dehydrogenase (short-subunit alcohol dehydrogenase family)